MSGDKFQLARIYNLYVQPAATVRPYERPNDAQGLDGRVRHEPRLYGALKQC